MNQDISKLYGNRVRIRVNGLCWWNNTLLMVNHKGLRSNNFWSPPGGGIEFMHTAADTLVREFAEETGIITKPGSFLFACEFIEDPLHAIELFFEAIYEAGEIVKGTDPEMDTEKQIIQEVKWMSGGEIKALPQNDLHSIFKICPEPIDLFKLSGYWQI